VKRHEEQYGEEFKPAIRARNALYFARTMKRRGVAHVHVHFANRACYTARFLKEIAGIPYSFTAHAQDFMVDLSNKNLLAELCEEASFVVTVSDFTKELLRGLCPNAAKRIHRVYNGIDLERFPLLPVPRAQVPLILSVGRLVEFKGFHHLIKACGELKRRGLTFTCEIVGEGPCRDALEQLILDEDVAGCVRLAGIMPQEQVSRRLAECEVFALASDIDEKGASDVLPTVILEAMAAGRPVVSTRVAGIPELVEHEVTGLLVERGDVQGLVRCLFRLLADHELRLRLGMGGRGRLERTFRVQDTSAQLMELFDHCTSEASALEQPPHAAFAYLLPEWPNDLCPVSDTELSLLAEMTPTPRLFVARPHLPFKARNEKLAASLDFLPDAMVLEAEWRHRPAIADSIEGLREELGPEIQTEVYLLQARRALHLIQRVHALGLRHLHAAGSLAGVTAWILFRLQGLPYSLSLLSSEELHPKVLEVLMKNAVGGRTGSAEAAKADVRFTHEPAMVPRSRSGVGSLFGFTGTATPKLSEPPRERIDAWLSRISGWLSHDPEK
jgi:glycosyltransferase involved in cell wall biosynthesis